MTDPAIPILIIDDELQSRSLIRNLLADEGYRDNIYEAGSVMEAIQLVQSADPRLVFLDIQMKGETGFDLLDKLSDIHFELVFTTAHSEYALKAFRYNAINYLVKPLDAEEFSTAFQKAIKRIDNGRAYPVDRFGPAIHQFRSGILPDKLTIPTLDGYLFINTDEVLYCRASNNYTEFFLTGKRKILASQTLGYYEELLVPQRFFRVHRSYLVNIGHIKMYKRGDGGTLIMNDDEEIEVSRNNKEAFLKLFKT